MTRRTEQVSSLVHKEVAVLLLKLDLPAMVTISKVQVSEDLRHAKVFISILPLDESTEKKVLDIISGQIYELQGALNKKLKIKIMPRLSFKVDYSSSFAQHINKLLKETKE